MKNKLNNPKFMAICSLTLISLSLLYSIVRSDYNIIYEIFRYSFGTTGFRSNLILISELIFKIILIIYFLLLLMKKKINLRVFNILILISSTTILLASFYSPIYLLIQEIIYLFLVCYFGYIFLYSNKTIKICNILSTIGIGIIIIRILYAIINYRYLFVHIIDIAELIYFIPLILFFRLYGISTIKKEV